MVCSRPRAITVSIILIVIAVLVIALPTVLHKTILSKHIPAPSPDNYTVALKKTLLFFDAQMSGKFPKNKQQRVPWRGSSGVNDGMLDVKGGLVGGYYDTGNNMKFNFPIWLFR